MISAMTDWRYAALPEQQFTCQTSVVCWHIKHNHRLAGTQMCTSHLMFCGSLLASFPQHWVSLVLRLLQDAAHWLMDQDSLERSEASWHARQEQLQRDAEQAARQEKASRKQLLDKYHLQAVPTSAYADVHIRSTQAPKSKVLLICHHHATSLSRSKLLSATKGFSHARCTALWLVTEPK